MGQLMPRLRRLTHCSVPGHGTRCVVADEMAGSRIPRCTEEAMALAHELAADEVSIREVPSS